MKLEIICNFYSEVSEEMSAGILRYTKQQRGSHFPPKLGLLIDRLYRFFQIFAQGRKKTCQAYSRTMNTKMTTTLHRNIDLLILKVFHYFCTGIDGDVSTGNLQMLNTNMIRLAHEVIELSICRFFTISDLGTNGNIFKGVLKLNTNMSSIFDEGRRVGENGTIGDSQLLTTKSSITLTEIIIFWNCSHQFELAGGDNTSKRNQVCRLVQTYLCSKIFELDNLERKVPIGTSLFVAAIRITWGSLVSGVQCLNEGLYLMNREVGASTVRDKFCIHSFQGPNACTADKVELCKKGEMRRG